MSGSYELNEQCLDINHVPPAPEKTKHGKTEQIKDA